MNLLLDPNIAYLLLLVGTLFGLLALVTPGTGALEVGALFCLLFAGYAITQLDFNLWALFLLVFSVAPFVYAIRKPKQEWALAIALLGLVVGSVFFFRNENGGPAVHPLLALAASLLYAGFLWVAIRKIMLALNENPIQNLERLVGRKGRSKTPVHESGSVQVASELWSARSDEPISAGSPIRVVRRDGFILVVEKENSAKSN